MERCLGQFFQKNTAKNSQKARKVPFSLLLQKAIFGIILPFLICSFPSAFFCSNRHEKCQFSQKALSLHNAAPCWSPQ
jgi:hypothetical protein